MIRNGQGRGERKLLVNSSADDRAVWPVTLPEAIKPGTTPTLTFTLPDGSTQAPALTVVRASDTVDGIGGGNTNDRRRLTKAAGGMASLHGGIPGVDYGAAHLITAQDGTFGIQVNRIEGSAIVLGWEVPKGVVIGAAPNEATVQYATWTCRVPVEVTAAQTVANPIPWVLRYTAKAGADTPDMPGQRIHGHAHVVNRMFQTGLTHSEFMVLASGLWPGAPFNHLPDWTPIIDQAFLRLVQMIRRDAKSSTRAEDDLDGAAFLDVHLHLTAALIRGNDEKEYTRQITEAERLMKVAMHRVLSAASSPTVAESQGAQGTDWTSGSFAGTDTSLTGTSRRVQRRIGGGGW